MTTKNWDWHQPSGRTWKIKTDQEAGTVLVFNEDNQQIMEQKDLSAEAVRLIEDNFVGIVTAPNDMHTPGASTQSSNPPQKDWNPMYA